jgi:hypothetical protein
MLIKGSVDGVNYTPTTASTFTSGTLVTTITAAFTGQVNVAGMVSFQLTTVSYTSGTINISLRASTSISNVMLDNPIPVGSNVIGKVGIDQTTPGTTNAVSVTNLPTTLTLNKGAADASTLRVTLGDGAQNIGAITNTSFAVTNAGTFPTQATLQTGSAVVGKVGIDQTTPGTTEAVSLKVSTGAGTAALVKDDTAFGDALTTGVQTSTNRLYNGTNYDRARGDATNGAWVNVKSTVNPVLAAGTNAIGTVGTTLAGVNIGQTTSNTVAVQLTASSIVPTNGVLIEALKANISTVYIGGSGVTTSTGFELQAGQAMSLAPTNINILYVIGSNNTDKVCWSVT